MSMEIRVNLPTKGVGLLEVSEDYLTPAQAARLLGVTSQWVVKLSNRGDLHAILTPLGRLIERRSVEELVRKKATAV